MTERHEPPARKSVALGLAATFGVLWILAAFYLLLIASAAPGDVLRVAVAPLYLMAQCPSPLIILIGLAVTLAPILLIILVLTVARYAVFIVWAHGALLVYWLWAIFLMSAALCAQ